MKKMGFLLILTVVSCQSQQFSPAALSEKLQSADGSQVTFQSILDKHKGHTIVIENWASWCGDCVKAMPKIRETQAAHPEADYVFISMDKAEDKWKEGIAKHNLKGDHYWATEGMKGSFGKSIDLDWIPRYIIVDKKGTVALYRAVETDFATINEKLKTLNE